MTIEELQVVITAQTSGITKGVNQVKSQMTSLNSTVSKVTSSIGKAFAAIGVTVGIAAAVKAIKNAVVEAATYEAQLQQITRTLGANSAEFMNWASTQAAGYGIARTEAAKYGMTFSNLVSSFTNSAGASQLTIQLMQTSAVIASRTGRTMEDVMERIRSGILGSTEAIEDLGVYTKVSAIEQTNAFKQMSGGKTWEKLNYNQQQAITTYAILEQAAKKFGNTMSNNTMTAMQQLRAQLSNLKTELGLAFKPIADIVIPFLVDMVKMLRTAVVYIAAFIQLLFGIKNSVDTQINDSLKESNETINSNVVATKAWKRALMGFDEINSSPLQDASTNLSAGSNGGITVPAYDMSSMTQGITDFNGKIEEARQNIMKWLPALSAIAAALSAIYVAAHYEQLMLAIGEVFPAIGGALANIGGWLGIVSPALADTSAVLGAATIPALIGVVAAIVAITAAIVDLWNTDSEFKNAIVNTWESIKETVRTVYENYIKPIFAGITNAAMNVWNNGLKPLWEAFKPFIKQAVLLITDLWNGVLKPIFDWLTKTFGPVVAKIWTFIADAVGRNFNVVLSIFTGVFNGLSAFIEGIRKALKGLIDFVSGVFTGDWKKAWNGIKDFVTGLFEGLVGFFYNLIKGPWNNIVDQINIAFSKINGMKINLFGVQLVLPTIPRLARGGIVDSGTVFMAGEAGKEVVMPLENNTQWIDLLASKLNGAGSSNRPVEVVLQLNNTELGRAVIDSINKLSRQEGRLLLNV